MSRACSTLNPSSPAPALLPPALPRPRRPFTPAGGKSLLLLRKEPIGRGRWRWILGRLRRWEAVAAYAVALTAGEFTAAAPGYADGQGASSGSGGESSGSTAAGGKEAMRCDLGDTRCSG